MSVLTKLRLVQHVVIAFIIVLSTVATAYAQSSGNRTTKANLYREQVNKGTVGIISGGIAGTYIRIATDLASVLDDNENFLLRILPIAGKGGVGNIRDLLYLRGVDLAIVQSDVLDFIENNKIFFNVRNRVHYVTKLYDAEFHIITRRNITDITQLRGKTVNFWHKGSATDMTGATVFRALGINVKPVYLDQQLALAKVKSGEIAANMLIVGKPNKRFTGITPQDGLHLLPLRYEGKLAEIYLPSKFTSTDYPGLVPQGKTVSTIASGAVLAVYNWPQNHPRYKKVARFIDSFFSSFSKFQKAPRHKKWREINLETKLPGWNRFTYADKWLRGAGGSKKVTVQNFRDFLRNQGRLSSSLRGLSPEKQNELFQRFLEWQNRHQ